MKVRSLTNTRNSDTPMISSGVTNENSMRKFAEVAVRLRHRSSPMAKATPRGTEISMVSEASFRLWARAERSAGSCQTERLGSPQYQRIEKPCHALLDLPELKENSTAMATGASDHTM